MSFWTLLADKWRRLLDLLMGASANYTRPSAGGYISSSSASEQAINEEDVLNACDLYSSSVSRDNQTPRYHSYGHSHSPNYYSHDDSYDSHSGGWDLRDDIDDIRDEYNDDFDY